MDAMNTVQPVSLDSRSERALRHQARWRRLLFFGLTFLTGLVAGLLMLDILKVNGQTLLNCLALPLFVVLFTWISGAFWAAIIGFVVRLIGHDPARLLVPSALTGAALLLSADIAVRIIPSTSDIKVGVLTSIIGVPFFLYLIMRERRALGGGVA